MQTSSFPGIDVLSCASIPFAFVCLKSRCHIKKGELKARVATSWKCSVASLVSMAFVISYTIQVDLLWLIRLRFHPCRCFTNYIFKLVSYSLTLYIDCMSSSPVFYYAYTIFSSRLKYGQIVLLYFLGVFPTYFRHPQGQLSLRLSRQ